MAAENKNSTPSVLNTFNKGMVKDLTEAFLGEGIYTHARNAVNNSHDGQMGVIGNEPSTLECLTLPYTMIGRVSIENGKWIVFSTDNTDSEIGIFNPADCSYVQLVNDPCLNFSTTNLITGESRRTFDCSEKIYWADGLNPDRVLDINNVPFRTHEVIVDGCATEVEDDPRTLDCERIRLASLVDIPCFTLKKAVGSGTLKNGTYQVFGAYAVNEIRVTDYFAISNPLPIWGHTGIAGAIELFITGTDTEFEELEIVVVSNVQGQTVAKRFGIYSTRQEKIYIDNINTDLVSVLLSTLPIQTPAYEKSDNISSVGGYLLRNGIYTKPDFNYQPLANQIKSKWVVEVKPADYYQKGGEDYGYLRDEIYSFFIRWIYNTGEKSASYHIPGRLNGANPDGASDGTMAYWRSSELYPDNNYPIWGSLCGQGILHHKFPDNTICPHFNPGGGTINILGIEFSNIIHPEDNQGNKIQSIVGYEILRGSREGHKSIYAKGLLTHVKEYTIPGGSTTGLYKNYPYDDLSASDPYYNPTQPVATDYAAFHSPDTVFSHPYLGNSLQLSVYQEHTGTATGNFEVPSRHPEFRIIGRQSGTLATVIGVLTGALTVIRAAGIGGTVALTGTEDLPMHKDIIGPLHIPDLATTAVGSGGNIAGIVLYAAGVITQAIIATFMAAIEANVTRQKMLDIISGFIPTRQYARQYNSHGFYDNYVTRKENYTVTDAGYIKSAVQTFNGKRVNNLFRSDYVLLNIQGGFSTGATVTDTSRVIGGLDTNQVFNSPISARYGALKVDIPSQYGQLDAIRQIPITCIQLTSLYGYSSTGTIFGGDTSIGRHTEKNPFLFYNDWLSNGEPHDIVYNYKDHQNLPDLKWWGVDNRKMYEGFFSSTGQFYSLDNSSGGDDTGWYVEPGVFYTFCNGTLDFFVESEVNVGYREWEDELSKRYYDPYGFTDLSQLYKSDIMRNGSYYKYDYSLSLSKLYNQFISWGTILPRSFDPELSESCYAYYPRRIIYSLPQSEEVKRDNWRSFLVNNYKDLPSKVTTVREVGKTGAMIFMEHDSPMMLNGVDSLQTDAGTEITVGSGSLFARQLQSIINTDDSYEYASCQNRYSVISVPSGIAWASTEQGKIFIYSGQLKVISDAGLKWWFSRYLPFEMLKRFPDYIHKDNSVMGISVQMTFDPTNEVLYITKRDFKPKSNVSYRDGLFYPSALEGINITGSITIGNNIIINPPVVTVDVCNPTYFEDCSWTVSYDLKTSSWISYHDWHPHWLIPTTTHFVSAYKSCTASQTKLWKHNQRTDSFCKFYDVDYPFEVEYAMSTGANVATVKNTEYMLECYKYDSNGHDKFHKLDFNFDRAIVRNSEQISDVLKLTLKSKTNPFTDMTLPRVDSVNNYTEILYSKEEQKYRFNQFWDITKDRGEFTAAENMLINTQPNGYKWNINPAAIDTLKSPLQRKKFRHTINYVTLKRNVCGNTKMLFKLVNTKLQPSQR